MRALHRPAAVAALSILALASAVTRPAPAHAQMTAPPASTPAAQPSPAPTAVPLPANPPENTLVTQRVRDTFLAWQHGRVDRKNYTPYAGGTYVDAYVKIVAPVLAIGAPQSVTYRTASLLLDDLVYRYDITGTSGDVVSVLYAIDQNGRTDSVVFTPQIFRTGQTAH